MRNHAHDAELMALKPEFDAVFDDWWAREEDLKLDKASRRYPSRTDAEIDEWADRIASITDEVLSHQPITRDGLALQCRAGIMNGFDEWDDRTARFIGNMVLFFGRKLPDTLMVELLTKGWPDEDEDADEEDEA